MKEIKRVLGMMLLVLPFFKVEYLMHLSRSVSLLYNVLALGVAAFAAVKYVGRGNIQSLKLNYFFLTLLLFNLSIPPFSMTEGLKSAYDLFEFYGSVIFRMALCGMIAYGLTKNPKRILSAVANVMTVLVLLNVVTIILIPQGLWTTGQGPSLTPYWILGYDNAHAVMYVYCLMFVGLVNYLEMGKVVNTRLILVYLLCMLVTVQLWTATSLVAMLVIGAYIFLPVFFRRFVSVLNIRTYLIAIAVMCVSAIGIAVSSAKQGGIIYFVLTTVLRKDVGFNSRSMIWTNYLHNISKHPLFGNGAEDAATMILKNTINGAHNEWLQILYYGGLIHLAFYFVMLYMVAKRLWKYRRSGCAAIVSVSIFAMMILQLMRGCPEVYWLSMYTVGYYIGYIEKQVQYAPEAVVGLLKE